MNPIGYYYYLKNETDWLVFGLISKNTFEVTTNRTQGVFNIKGDWSIVFENEFEKINFEEWARPFFTEEKSKQNPFSLAIPNPKDTIPAYDSINMLTMKTLFIKYKNLELL